MHFHSKYCVHISTYDNRDRLNDQRKTMPEINQTASGFNDKAMSETRLLSAPSAIKSGLDGDCHAAPPQPD